MSFPSTFAANMIGAIYGRLTIVEELDRVTVGVVIKSTRRQFECRCACGATTRATQIALATGNKQSCGCLRKESARARRIASRREWIAGTRIDFLTVLHEAPPDAKGRRRIQCVCDCGATIAVAPRGNGTLMSKSCGCKRAELVRQLKTKHGFTKRGGKINPWYATYGSVKARAEKAGVPCDFTGRPEQFVQWAVQRFAALEGICPILGVVMRSAEGRWDDDSPTIDRVIPALGYVFSNMEIISHRANQIKNDASLAELKALVRYVESRTS